jgi:hypothetical protein
MAGLGMFLSSGRAPAFIINPVILSKHFGQLGVTARFYSTFHYLVKI